MSRNRLAGIGTALGTFIGTVMNAGSLFEAWTLPNGALEAVNLIIVTGVAFVGSLLYTKES